MKIGIVFHTCRGVERLFPFIVMGSWSDLSAERGHSSSTLLSFYIIVFQGTGEDTKRKTMKKICLICMSMALYISVYATTYPDVTKSITMMIGASEAINPYADAGISASVYESMDYKMYSMNSEIIDNSAFTVNSTQHAASGNNYYYIYKLDALRKGTFRMIVTLRYTNKTDSGTFMNTPLTVTYNINVVDVTQINMPSSLNLQPGDTYTLTPQILETGATSVLTWTSSNTGVAIVNNSGAIRVLRVGSTDITCTAYNGVSATCRLNVVPIIAEGFSLEETACELEPGETFTLNSVFTPANTTDQSVTYKSSNTKVATVDAEGVVTAVNKGNCTITASTNDGSYMSATCAVTVKPIVTSIFLQNTMEMTVGQTEALEPVIEQEGATTTLTWRSSNTSVATVSDGGAVYAAKAGTTTITCTASNGVTASCTLTVNPQSDYLYINNATAITGGQMVLPVMMANKAAITACQFDLSLPTGVSISDYQLTSRKADQSISVKKQVNGDYRVAILSSTSAAFSGSDGALANLTLDIAATAANGRHTLAVKDIELTSTGGEAINPADMTATMIISDVQMGDTNGDGKITITDAVAIVNYLLGNASPNFVYEASDVNGDRKTTITDAVAIVNIILSSSSSTAPRKSALDPQ